MKEREIRFRVWDISESEMIEDPYYFRKSPDSFPLYQYAKTWRNEEDGEWADCYVMQLTDLKDKDGKEIWEGDILATKLADTVEKEGFYWIYCPVVFKNGAFGYLGDITQQFYPFCTDDTEWEIAGNIYADSRLLKKNVQG